MAVDVEIDVELLKSEIKKTYASVSTRATSCAASAFASKKTRRKCWWAKAGQVRHSR